MNILHRYILGNVDLLTDLTSSGFALIHEANQGCRLNFTVRNYNFYQHQDFGCSYDYWYKVTFGYHQALGGYYRHRNEREFSSRWGTNINNLFSMTKVFVSPYTFNSVSTLYLGMYVLKTVIRNSHWGGIFNVTVSTMTMFVQVIRHWEQMSLLMIYSYQGKSCQQLIL